jgi:integrase
MAVVGKKRKTGITYYAVFNWQGKQVWEPAGKDKREAGRIEKRFLDQVANGTYLPGGQNGATTVSQYMRQWLDGRGNRTAANDRSRLEKYVLTKEDFCGMPIADVRPKHVIALIAALKKTIGERTKAPLSPKSVANTYTAIRTMFRDAQIAELIAVSPCVIPRGVVRHRTVTKKVPYERDEASKLVRDLRVESNKRVFAAMLFFTGMRTGEVAGRRWKHWLREAKPLTALQVDTQFDDQPLKTAEEVGEQPRMVPVHPELSELLAWWWSEGYEQFYCRKPSLHGFILPMESNIEAPHTNSSAYRILRTACKRAEVQLRGVHSTRRTFISLARRAGARKDVVERITHNARGDIVDVYTFWDWKPLCEAVTLVTLDEATGVSAEISAPAAVAESKWSRGGSKQRSSHTTSQIQPEVVDPQGQHGGLNSPRNPDHAAGLAARQGHAPLRKAAVGLAALRALEADFDRLWAEDLGVELPEAGGTK